MNIMNDLRAHTAQELLDLSLPPQESVLEPWLRTEEGAIIWAASGVGKTWLCLSIALAVAGGGSVGEWTAPKPRKVLYIDGEMNLRDLQERIRQLLDQGAVKVPDRGVALGNLELVPRSAQALGQDFIDLTDKGHHGSILKRVQGKVDLVIFDNLTTLSEGLEDENDATEFRSIQGLFIQLKAAGVAMILVHHANKSQKQMRGTTSLETTFEVILGLLKPTTWGPRGATFIAEFTKFRGLRDGRTDPKLWTLPNGGVWELSHAEPEEARDLPAVKLLRTGTFKTQAAIAKELGVEASTVTRQFQRAVEAGVLTKGGIKEWFEMAKEGGCMGSFEETEVNR